MLMETNIVTVRNMKVKPGLFIVVEIWKLLFMEIPRRNATTNGRSVNV
jgi:nitrogen fixation protein